MLSLSVSHLCSALLTRGTFNAVYQIAITPILIHGSELSISKLDSYSNICSPSHLQNDNICDMVCNALHYRRHWSEHSSTIRQTSGNDNTRLSLTTVPYMRSLVDALDSRLDSCGELNSSELLSNAHIIHFFGCCGRRVERWALSVEQNTKTWSSTVSPKPKDTEFSLKNDIQFRNSLCNVFEEYFSRFPSERSATLLLTPSQTKLSLIWSQMLTLKNMWHLPGHYLWLVLDKRTKGNEDKCLFAVVHWYC